MKSRSGSSSIDADIALEDLSVPADFSAGEAQVEVSVLLPIERRDTKDAEAHEVSRQIERPCIYSIQRAMAVIETSSGVLRTPRFRQNLSISSIGKKVDMWTDSRGRIDTSDMLIRRTRIKP